MVKTQLDCKVKIQLNINQPMWHCLCSLSTAFAVIYSASKH